MFKCETEGEGEGDDVVGTKLTGRRGALVPPKMIVSGKDDILGAERTSSMNHCL